MTSIRIVSNGEDNVGKFAVSLPGKCDSCGENVDVCINYSSVAQVKRNLKQMNIDPESRSLILKRPWGIGVTCGCYGKWMRQVAHISSKREPPRKSRKYG